MGPELVAGLPADAAFSVWQVLRTLALWTAEPERRRGELFDRDYMESWERTLLTGPLEPEVRFPLAVVVGELAASPAGEGRLSWACVCVADWALGRGAVRAGLAFAEAAALASPLQPRYAWLVGRLMRTHGDPRTAERWLRRAHRLAVTQRDWETQARALTALGNLSLQAGRYPDARALHGRALRVSRRWRLREQEGMALHDLFVIATDEGNRAEAERHARGAVEAYRSSPHRMLRLTHDVAYSWMYQGYCGRAVRVFSALRPHFSHPDEAVRVVANLARAAAGSGDRGLYEQNLSEARSLIPLLDSAEALAPALLELAYGAVALEDWTRALELSGEALAAARARGEANVLLRAEALEAAVTRRDATLVEEVVPERRVSVPTGEDLATEMVALLTRAPADAA
jgi:tetratricopeptide (TPR) repeat protein